MQMTDAYRKSDFGVQVYVHVGPLEQIITSYFITLALLFWK